MRDLASALLSLPWAMSLFGMEQLARLTSGSGQGRPRDVEANLYRATKATESQMTDVFWAVYQMGDSMQRTAIDLLAEAFTGCAQDRGCRDQILEHLAVQTAESADTLLSHEGRAVALTQLRNNLEVFNLVKSVRNVLNIPARDQFGLDELVRQAYRLGDFPDLWAIEGLGHDYADRFWSIGELPTGILQNEWARTIPRSSLTMLHAGIGLSFAQRLMKTITPYDRAAEIQAVLQHYIALCEANSWAGYEGAALESLGLVTRTWHPQMVGPVDEHLAELDERAREFFWHGAGRALYFHPLYIVPGILSPWRAADREPLDDRARLNMKAGLAWATTLVNLRQPDVLERLILTHGEALDADDAFSAGLASALTMAQDITPRDKFIAALGDYRPRALTGDALVRWERLVMRPYIDATERIQPRLAALELLGEVFRYHPYPGWFDAIRLGASAAPGVVH